MTIRQRIGEWLFKQGPHLPFVLGFFGVISIFFYGTAMSLASGDNFYVNTSCVALAVLCIGLWPIRKAACFNA